MLVLEATAFDREDGQLGVSSIAWSSSLDGTLANTGSTRVSLSMLTTGTHVLTASAIDSNGASTSMTVSGTINEHNTPAEGVDDTAYRSAACVPVIADVLANDIDTERDISPGTLTVLVPASQGNATVGPAAGPGHPRPAVEYISTETGYDVLVYEVCDRLHQCSTAELTIVTGRAQPAARP